MYRTLLTKSPRLAQPAKANARCFTTTFHPRLGEKPKTEKYPDDKHAVNKVREGDTHNIQESNAKAGIDAHNSGTGGHATERKDSAGGKQKAKQEFPEAPDVAIGMQDERGGRGA